MIRPINVGETLEYVLKGDTEDSTTWTIGILDSLVKTRLTDIGMVYKYNPEAPGDSLAESHMNIAEQDLEFVKFGLKGFKNFKQANGSEVAFKTEKKVLGNIEYDVVSDDTLKFIPRMAITELAKKIAEENVITEAEEKN